jgi:UDP:flavonoid glycosyltransferase YjiC (YdhE family)
MNNQRSVLALISARGGGDAPPVIALAKSLNDRGHSVIVICDEETEEAVRDTNLKTLALPPELDETTYFDNWRNSVTGDVDENTPNPLAIWGELTLPYVKEKVEAFHPDLVISSLFCMGLADELAQAFDIPWCFVNPSFYFGDYQARNWAEDWYGSFVQWIARYCFDSFYGNQHLVYQITLIHLETLGYW